MIVWEIIGGVIATCALLGIGYGFRGHVENIINKKLEDPETIRKILKFVRPSVVFDDKGVVIADLGGMDLIDSLDIGYDEKEQGLPIRIEVKFKEHMKLPPLLTSIDDYTYEEDAVRGKDLSWIFNLEPHSYSSYEDESGVKFKFRFRLEIIR